ncbi:MAG: hypothetical protein HY287_05790 [Planctomycetes bacterium]|nr:hypothetical protein [Planctomycetota bacterium]
MNRMLKNDQFHIRSYTPSAVIAILAFAIGLACWCGCGHDARLAGQKVQNVQVKAVTLYGQTLDAQATPEQVAFAALQAIREDVLATTTQAREAALDKEFDLAAADEIQSRNHSSMGRDEFIYNVVYRWAPTVSYYVADFPTTWEQAQKRFGPKKLTPLPTAKSEGSAKECEIPIEVADPNGDPNARVIILIWLNQDHGFWRVMHFGFDTSRRKLEVTSSF